MGKSQTTKQHPPEIAAVVNTPLPDDAVVIGFVQNLFRSHEHIV